MNSSHTATPTDASFELSFTCLSDRGQDCAFPCDAQGHVRLDELGNLGRCNYFFARAVAGNELSTPVVRPVAPSSPGFTVWRIPTPQD